MILHTKDDGTRLVELEPTDCRACQYNPGKQSVKVLCPTCGGSGKGVRGGRGGCKTCYGNKTIYATDTFEPCMKCNGEPHNKDMENWCDSVPRSFFNGMPINIVDRERNASWNEQYLGHGYLWSVVDYGQHKHVPAGLVDRYRDWQTLLVETVRYELHEKQRVQLSKLVRSKDDLRLCDALTVICTRDGYSIRADFKED